MIEQRIYPSKEKRNKNRKKISKYRITGKEVVLPLFMLPLYGLLLLPVLLLSLISKKVRIKWWHKLNGITNTYKYIPCKKAEHLFSLCICFLMLVANRLDMTYT